LRPFCCLHLHLRPVASVWLLASSCVQLRALASACVLTCVRTCVRLRLRPFALRPLALSPFCCLRLHLRPHLRPIYCLRLHLRPFGSLASLWLLASSCLLGHALASACVGTCVRFAVCVCTCVQLLVAMALLALVGPTKKTNIATNHPPYPFVLLAFYL
jgi:hypothetical protein